MEIPNNTVTRVAPTTWQEWIDWACGQGFKVQWREEVQGYVIITPKGFRKPSEEFGWYPNERMAWKSAAFMAHRRASP